MLSLLFIWLFLLGITLVTGVAAQLFFRTLSLGSTGDQVFRALWLGLLMLGWGLLLWSLFLPVTLWTAAMIVLICGGGLAACKTLREECVRLLKQGFHAAGVLPLILAPAVALAVMQPMVNRDVLAYHLDFIQVMSRVGLVPGLGLIHDRFGFVSSWYAIPALFNHGPLSGRMGAAANGYVFFLMLSQLCMSSIRLLRSSAGPTDGFVAAAFTLGTFFPVYLGFPVGSTADFAVLLYILATAWTAATVFSADKSPPAGFRDPRLLPVFMGALLFSVKLSAIPVPAMAGMLYLISCRFHPKAFLLGGAFMLFMLPWFAASILVTGYLMYPSSLHFPLPWTLGHHHALNITHWGQPGRLGAPSLSLEWVRRWLALSVTHRIGFGYFVLGVLTVLGIWVRHRRRVWEFAPFLLTGGIGVAFLIARAPSVRFGWGYLVILPCSFFALFTPAIQRKADHLRISPLIARCVALALCLLILFALSYPGWTESHRRVRAAVQEGRLTLDATNRLLLPPLPPRIVFDDQAGTVSPNLWHEDDPRAYLGSPRAMTYPLVPPAGVRYRDPGAGPRRGFEHE